MHGQVAQEQGVLEVALQGGTKWPLLGGHNVFKWPYKEVPSGLH